MKSLTSKLGAFVRVEKFDNGTGNNLLVVFEHGSILESYLSVVAAKYYDKDISVMCLGVDHNASTTTSKYVKMYTGLDSKTREKWLEEGLAVRIK